MKRLFRILVPVILSLLLAFPIPALARDSTINGRPDLGDKMDAGWRRVDPVVEIPNYTGAVLHATGGEVLEEELKNVGDRTRFSLMLPGGEALKGEPLQAIGYWQGDVIVGIEVLYRSRIGDRSKYWVAGQLARPKEDPDWADIAANVPVATRFWKYRTTGIPKIYPKGASIAQEQVQLYRFHDGVESWVGGQLTKDEAVRAAESFREVYKQGISPIIVIILGLLLVLIWPLWLTWRYVRRFPGGIPKR